MSTRDFLQGFMQGFNNTGGPQKLSSYAAKNIAGGKYYNPWEDPMAIQQYLQAKETGIPDMQNQFTEEYGDYIDYPEVTTPVVEKDYNIPYAGSGTLTSGGENRPMNIDERQSYLFGNGGQSASISLKAALAAINPEGNYSFIPEDTTIGIKEFEDVTGFPLLGADLERGVLRSEIGKNTSQAGLYDNQGNYYYEQALTEQETRPGEVEKLKQDAYAAESSGDHRRAQELKTLAEKKYQDLENIYYQNSAVDLGEILSAMGAPESTAGSFRDVPISAYNLNDIPLTDIANSDLTRQNAQVEINKLNQEIKDIAANTQLTQEEKQTEISTREYEIRRLQTQAAADMALANQRSIFAKNDTRLTDYKISTEQNAPGDTLDGLVPNIFKDKKDYILIDTVSDGRKVYQGPLNFIWYQDGTHVIDDNGNWLIGRPEEGGGGKFITKNPGADLNIPYYQQNDAKGEDDPTFFQNLLRLFPGGEKPQWGNNNTTNEQSMQQNNIIQKATLSINDVINKYKQKNPGLTYTQIAERLREMVSPEEFKNETGLNLNYVIDRLNMMR